MKLNLWIQPRASRTEVVGRYGDTIRIRIAAPPVDGAANEELIRFLARELALPQSAVRVKAGASGRRKTVEVGGLTLEEAEKRLGVRG